MSVKPTTKAERSEATRAALLAAARDVFAERGYAEAATEEIVRRAGVTRGALYHHFRDKEKLFEAVFESIEQELLQRTVERAADAPDLWAKFLAGCHAFLDSCTEPAVQRIALIDAPAVLGWERWREIESSCGLGLIRAGLQLAIDEKIIHSQPVGPLAHMILAALDEAALLIARAPDPHTARADVGPSLERLLNGLRLHPPRTSKRPAVSGQFQVAGKK